jgi:hypothetical protein
MPRRERLARQSSLDLLEDMGRLLVCCLSSGRNILVRFAIPGTGRAVADDKNVLVAGCLQGRCDDQLVEAVCLQTIEILEHIGRFNAGGPDDEFRRNKFAACKFHAVCRDLSDF